MDYPDNCLRGIPNAADIPEDGLVGSSLFLFSDQHVRSNGEFVQSVNWEDDDQAISFTLAQRERDGSLQFGGGVAVIPRAELDRMSRLPTFGGNLSYDRQPLPENRYHGNLILAPHISKGRRRQMAATIAMHVSTIVHRPVP